MKNFHRTILAATAFIIVLSGTGGAVDPAFITQLAVRTHADFRNAVRVKRLKPFDAARVQKDVVARQPGVSQTRQLKNNNLYVRFQDGKELVMLLGDETMGSAAIAAPMQPMSVIKGAVAPNLALTAPPGSIPVQSFAEPAINPPATATMQTGAAIAAKPGAPLTALLSPEPVMPGSGKALVFDCVADNINRSSPPVWQSVVYDLMCNGYQVTAQLNDEANLANAALIDDGEYGVVFLRGHGTDLGGDFGFFVRPWYTSYPSGPSGFAGTIPASAWNYVTNRTEFGRLFTGLFATNHWKQKTFPGTYFFLLSCHGTDPGALPGMPTFALNRGAALWMGWDESVKISCGDTGTALFFDKFLTNTDVASAIQAVYATGCRPPNLTSYPAIQRLHKLGRWWLDPNEGTVDDARDFRSLRLNTDGTRLFINVGFHAAPAFDKFYIDLLCGPPGPTQTRVVVKCFPTYCEVYKQSQPGTSLSLAYTWGTAFKNGEYRLSLPWEQCIGSANLAWVYLYDMTSKDTCPDTFCMPVSR